MTGVGVLDVIFSNIGGAEATTKRIRLFGTDVLPRIRDLGQQTSGVEQVAEVVG
jgi:hypothetical protein